MTPKQTMAQDCNLLAKEGIYDYSSTSYDEKMLNSFIDWFKSQTYTSLENAKSHNAGLDIIYKATPIKGSYSDGESGFSQLKQDIESYKSGNTEIKTKLITVLKQINPAVTVAMNNCLTQAGLHAWLETTYNPKVFKLAIKLTPDSEKTFETINSPLQFDNAECNPRIIGNGTRITPSTRRVLCTRIRPELAASVSVNAQKHNWWRRPFSSWNSNT